MADSLRGSLLVAGPTLLDPNFRRTVVLIADHDDEGASGVVLNRTSDLTVAEAAPPLAGLVETGELLHIGGPVQPQAAVVLADFAHPELAERIVFGSVGLLTGEEAEDARSGIRRARVFAGYAGWGSGQLEAELEENSWIVEPALPEDVFTDAPDGLWSVVLKRMGGDYAMLALMPYDPSTN